MTDGIVMDGSGSEMEALIRAQHAEIPHGWCTIEKALMLSRLIVEHDVRMAVEVGIFGGKSYFPMVLTMKTLGRGEVYGVEPWSNQVAVATETGEANDAWWSTVDMPAIKRTVYEHMARFDLFGHGRLVELTSDEAMACFGMPRFRGIIDMVHIDGAHSVQQSVYDVSRWLELLKPGGLIVLDDIAWPSVAIAKSYLEFCAEKVSEWNSPTDGSSYGVYRKPS